MAYPIKKCVVCGEEFELMPNKPGFANRCPDCTEAEGGEPGARGGEDEFKANSEMNAERRKAMRELLYRKDS